MLKFYATNNIIIDEKHNEYPYTYEVLRALKKDYPNDELYLRVGVTEGNFLPPQEEKKNEKNEHQFLEVTNIFVELSSKINGQKTKELVPLEYINLNSRNLINDYKDKQD